MTATKMTYLRNEKGEFVCPDCGVTKARQNTMFYHMKKHAGDLKHVCTVCDKGFIQKSGLQQHMLQAHPTEGCAPTWECPLCPHTCRMKSNMLIHIGRKHGEGWIPCIGAEGGTCTGCKKTFASATAYYYHAVQCFPAPTSMVDALATFGSGASTA
jgi:rubredoxin